MTRHRLTWASDVTHVGQCTGHGKSLPTGHAYLPHTVEAERLARRVAVRMSMARTIKETLGRGADPPSDLNKLTRRSTMCFSSDSPARQPLLLRARAVFSVGRIIFIGILTDTRRAALSGTMGFLRKGCR